MAPAPPAPVTTAVTTTQDESAAPPESEIVTAPPAPEIELAKAPAPEALTADAAGGGAPPNLTSEQLAVIRALDLNREQLIARLTALLGTAPESMRPLIEQAIRNLETGYQNAINNWALPQNAD